MKGIVSADRSNGQHALLKVEDEDGRPTYAQVTADLADVQRLAGENNSLGYTQITDLTAPHWLEPPAGTQYALIMPEGGSVRWRDDGTDPTAGVGMPLTATGELRYDGDFSKLKFIQQDVAAVLNVTFYGAVGNA